MGMPPSCTAGHDSDGACLPPLSAPLSQATFATELATEKIFYQGRDKQGRPLAIIQVRKHNAWSREIGEVERLCCFVLDHLVRPSPLHTHDDPPCWTTW